MNPLRLTGIVVSLAWMLLGASATMAEDCNGNGIFDHCDLDCGPFDGPCDIPGCGESEDCNGNLVPDECDLLGGTGFAAARQYPVGDAPFSVASGDLDNDGDDDLAVANSASVDVSVLPNYGDDTLDIGQSKAAFGPCTPESPPPCFVSDP